MSDLQLYNEIMSLPENLKQEISDFMEFLKSQSKNRDQITPPRIDYTNIFSNRGACFDEPLGDFNEQC